jgi:hypothetical protein
MRGVILLACCLTAAPASAQFTSRPVSAAYPAANPFAGGSGVAGPGTWRETGNIRDHVDAARDAGSLSRHDAHRFDRAAAHIDALADRFDRDGLLADEQRELDFRTGALRDQVNARILQGSGKR